MHIFGEADFVCPVVNGPTSFLNSGASTIQHDHMSYSTQSFSGHASLPARVNSPSHHSSQNQQQSMGRRNELSNISFRSTVSASTTTNTGHSLAMLSLPHANLNSQHVEAQFRIKYSGGEAMQQGYCRQCAIAFSLELIPSAVITNWDVLPAEM